MSIAVAAPWRFDLRRFGRLHEHEFAHLRGHEHEDMDRDLLLSLGPTPSWAEGATFRYHRRAPPQLSFLRSRQSTQPARAQLL